MSGAEVQSRKYNGKELDRMLGLDLYDYGARSYDPAIGMFTSIDPLCEKYYHLSPYAYCADNPVKWVDSDGEDYHVYINETDQIITISAIYYVMESDMKDLQRALDYWNNQSFEIKGYTVGFDLKAIEVDAPFADDKNKKRNLEHILMQEEYNAINNDAESSHNNCFYITSNLNKNENGATSGQMVALRRGNKSKLAGAHEIGHSLGFIHSDIGLMTPESDNPNRSKYISPDQVWTVVENAKNGYRYTDKINSNVGRGYVKYIK